MKEKYQTSTRSLQVNLLAGEVDSVQSARSMRTYYRVYENKQLCIAKSVHLCDRVPQYDQARQRLDCGAHPYPHLPCFNRQENLETQPQVLEESETVQWGEKISQMLREKFSSWRFEGVLSLQNSEHEIFNEKNLYLHHQDGVFTLELTFTDPKGYKRPGRLFHQYRQMDLKTIERELQMLTTSFHTLQEAGDPTRKNLVFSTLNPFLMHMFEKSLQPDNLFQNNSRFSRSLNMRIFPASLTLLHSLDPFDSAHRLFSLPFFDAEGSVNPGHAVPLIQEGVLLSPYTDKASAERYQIANTGSAQMDPRGYYYPGASGLCLAKSQRTLQELAGESYILIHQALPIALSDEVVEVQVSQATLFENGQGVARLLPFAFEFESDLMYQRRYLGVSFDPLQSSDMERAVVFGFL